MPSLAVHLVTSLCFRSQWLKSLFYVYVLQHPYASYIIILSHCQKKCWEKGKKIQTFLEMNKTINIFIKLINIYWTKAHRDYQNLVIRFIFFLKGTSSITHEKINSRIIWSLDNFLFFKTFIIFLFTNNPTKFYIGKKENIFKVIANKLRWSLNIDINVFKLPQRIGLESINSNNTNPSQFKINI